MGRLQSEPRPTAATDMISCAPSPAPMSLRVTRELETTTGAIIPRMPTVAATAKAKISFEIRTLDLLPAHDSVIAC